MSAVDLAALRRASADKTSASEMTSSRTFLAAAKASSLSFVLKLSCCDSFVGRESAFSVTGTVSSVTTFSVCAGKAVGVSSGVSVGDVDEDTDSVSFILVEDGRTSSLFSVCAGKAVGVSSGVSVGGVDEDTGSVSFISVEDDRSSSLTGPLVGIASSLEAKSFAETDTAPLPKNMKAAMATEAIPTLNLRIE